MRYIQWVWPLILEHHCMSRACPGEAKAIIPAVIAIEVITKINLRMGHSP